MPNDPITAACRRDYKAVHSSGKRNVKDVIWIVMHDEEAKTAAAAASWFANPKSAGSAHICTDDNVCYRTLDNDETPWAAPGANTKGFHIEQAGYAAWSAVIWKSHMKALNRAAFKAAYHCHLFNIPPRFLWAADLKAGKKGITTHAECTKAFGGSHTDPGKGWPRRLFLQRVRYYYALHANPHN